MPRKKANSGVGPDEERYTSFSIRAKFLQALKIKNAAEGVPSQGRGVEIAIERWVGEDIMKMAIRAIVNQEGKDAKEADESGLDKGGPQRRFGTG